MLAAYENGVAMADFAKLRREWFESQSLFSGGAPAPAQKHEKTHENLGWDHLYLITFITAPCLSVSAFRGHAGHAFDLPCAWLPLIQPD